MKQTGGGKKVFVAFLPEKVTHGSIPADLSLSSSTQVYFDAVKSMFYFKDVDNSWHSYSSDNIHTKQFTTTQTAKNRYEISFSRKKGLSSAYRCVIKHGDVTLHKNLSRLIYPEYHEYKAHIEEAMCKYPRIDVNQLEDVPSLDQRSKKTILGSGGEGTVYKCIYGGKVVVKKIFKRCTINFKWDELMYHQDVLQGILREFECLFTFNHPNIIKGIGIVFNEGEGVFNEGEGIEGTIDLGVVMNFYESNLKKFVENHPNMMQKLNIAIQICKGLEYMHEAYFVHRDIKPDNILMDTSDSREVKPIICDFGISRKQADNEGRSRRSNTFNVGTPRFMAPEINLRNNPEPEANYDGAKADIYSLGITLYYIFTELEPFSELYQNIVVKVEMDKMLRDSSPSLENTSIDGNLELKKLLTQCWDKNLEGRPDIAYVIQQLETIKTNLKHPTPVLSPPHVHPRTRRSHWAHHV